MKAKGNAALFKRLERTLTLFMGLSPLEKRKFLLNAIKPALRPT